MSGVWGLKGPRTRGYPGPSSGAGEVSPLSESIRPSSLQIGEVLSEAAPSQASRQESAYSRWKDPIFWAIFVIGVLLRCYHLGFPGRQMFDEVYYVPAAEDYISCRADTNSVHPPLAKIQMALIYVVVDGLGFRNPDSGLPQLSQPEAWRIPSLLFGILTLWWTHRLAWAVCRRRFFANTALFFVASDFLCIVQSRIAMLDQIQAFWILAGLTATAELLCQTSEELEDPKNRLRSNSQLWGAGICFGIATACKWNGVAAAAGAFAGLLGLVRTPYSQQLGLAGKLKVFAVFLVTGLGVYILSYGPYVGYTPFQNPALPPVERKGLSAATQDIVGFHKRMIRFRYNKKEFVHRYLSPFWQWPLVARPVWYLYDEFPTSSASPDSPSPTLSPSKAKQEQSESKPSDQPKTVNGIVAIGSVIFWWPAFLLLLESAYLTVRRRSSLENSDVVSQICFCFYFPQWLFWIAGTTGGFFYYMLPMVPVMALVMARYVEEEYNSKSGPILAKAYLVVIVVALILYYPLLTGISVPEVYFRRLFMPSSWI
jgi:dolichyl-phosphate-mannose-protein mannosyltransferase